MEPKSDSVIIIADTNKGPGPITPSDDVIDTNSKSDGDSDHDQDHHDYVGAISAAAPAAVPAPASNNNKKKRSGGAMQILRLAAFMLRRHRSSDKFKSKSIPVSLEAEAVASSKSTWKRLLGSIRPLHLQSGSSNPLTPSASYGRSKPERTASFERYEEVLPPPRSLAWTDDFSSEDGMTSRYASAVNLQELDRTEDDDNAADTNAIAAGPGPATTIDAKAEEFIAQFYQQMKLQRLDSIDRRYNDMKHRSIG